MELAIAFLFGLALGSFLNVVIFRLHTGEPVVNSRSKCLKCGKILSWKELIPVLSFIIQKGRCRACGFPFSMQYPLVELTMGFLSVYFAFYAFRSPFFITSLPSFSNFLVNFIFGLAVSGLLVVIFFHDLRYKVIPDKAVFILAFLSLLPILFSYSSGSQLRLDLFSSLFIALFLAALWYFSEGKWMGLGDAKLIFATSLLARFPASLSAFLFAFWAGALVGLILLILKKAELKTQIPFGPFIIAGFLVSLFFQISF